MHLETESAIERAVELSFQRINLWSQMGDQSIPSALRNQISLEHDLVNKEVHRLKNKFTSEERVEFDRLMRERVSPQRRTA